MLLTLCMFAPSEDRPAPNHQEGAVADQDKDRLTAGKAGKDWEATSLRDRWETAEREGRTCLL